MNLLGMGQGVGKWVPLGALTGALIAGTSVIAVRAFGKMEEKVGIPQEIPIKVQMNQILLYKELLRKKTSEFEQFKSDTNTKQSKIRDLIVSISQCLTETKIQYQTLVSDISRLNSYIPQLAE
jgi:hypothetical protein